MLEPLLLSAALVAPVELVELLVAPIVLLLGELVLRSEVLRLVSVELLELG